MSLSPAAARLVILSRSRVFQAAPTVELEELARHCTTDRYRRGTRIMRRGSPVDTLIVVGRGLIRTSLFSADTSGEFIVGVFSTGDVFGEISVFCGHSLPMDAVTITDAEVLFVPRSKLVGLLGRLPDVSIRMLESTCEKLHSALDLSLSLRFLDLPSRLYQRLVYLSRFDSRLDRNGFHINHGLSQRELADSIGVSREALNKLVGEWKRDGLVEYGRGYVVVRDPGALAMRLPAAARHGPPLGGAANADGREKADGRPDGNTDGKP